MEGFDAYDFTASDLRHRVFSVGDGAPVLLLHELPGLAQPAIHMAFRLAGDGFQVHMPHLFGELQRYAPLRNYRALCISKEFARLRAGEDAPVVAWLKALVAEMCRRSGSERAGAIGMCVTGAFAIPLILAPNVRAAVAAQPAIPISFAHFLFGTGADGKGRQLNVSEQELERAAERSRTAKIPLLAMRFLADRVCPHARMSRLRESFQEQVEIHELDAPSRIFRRKPHAVLTEEFDKGVESARLAYQRLTGFLHQHLNGA
jgi:dienelactone hydrolase